jgi:ribosomal protein S6
MANAEDRGEMTVYEIGYLVLPSIPEDGVENVVNTIKKIVSDAGAKELDSEAPHKRDLAYPMSKTVGSSKYVVNDAYVGWLKFEGEPEKVGEVKSGVEKIDEILRFLLIKAPRETTFTFASAKSAKEAPVEEAGEDPESSEGDSDTDAESVVE